MIVKAIVEMPTGTNYKYEYNKETDRLALDRVLNQEVPYNYGFILNTNALDGDPLDVFVLSNSPIPPMTEVSVELCYAYLCEDTGIIDDKLVGVLVGENERWFPEAKGLIQKYLDSYKPGFKVFRLSDKKETEDLYVEATK